jgi:hypothetical protein
MAKSRLVTLYPLKSQVEIRLTEAGWQPGQVVAHDHPGLWVAVTNGRLWFVTNRRHIRPLGADEAAADEAAGNES